MRFILTDYTCSCLSYITGQARGSAKLGVSLDALASTVMSFVPILSVEAYRAHYQLRNVKPVIHLDASLPYQYWGGIQPQSLDLVVNINMIHISPFACTEVLFKTSSRY